jgi:hypothetical protein
MASRLTRPHSLSGTMSSWAVRGERAVVEGHLEARWWAIMLILELAEGYVLLAHLRAGSVEVRPGDVVSAGQPLASCGTRGTPRSRTCTCTCTCR